MHGLNVNVIKHRIARKNLRLTHTNSGLITAHLLPTIDNIESGSHAILSQ